MADIANIRIIDAKEETDETGGKTACTINRPYERSDDESSACDSDTSIYWGAENLMYLYTSPCILSTAKKNLYDERVCQLCCTTKTPLWRRTAEYHTLCNACGIRVRTGNDKNKKR